MSIQVQNIRGTAAQNAVFIGAAGQLVWLTDEKRWVGHDGATPGGIPMARLDEISEDTYREFGNANVTVQISDGRLMLNAALTAARAVTLPAANAVPGGKTIRISDKVAGINGTNVLNLTRSGSDTINGAAGPIALSLPRGQWEITSDGVSNWTIASVVVPLFTGDSGSGGARGLVPPPAAGDAAAGRVLHAGGAWANVALPKGYFSGLGIDQDPADVANDFVVHPGAARDSGDARNLILTVDCVKQLDVAFAEYTLPGTASGGRYSGDNLTGPKWLHVFLIGGAGKNTQPFAQTSLTPTLPTGFTEWRLIRSLWWTGSNIKATIQVGRRCYFTNPDAMDYDGTVGTTAQLIAVRTPAGRKCTAILQALTSHGSAFAGVRLSDPNAIDLAPSFNAAPLSTLGGGGGVSTAVEAQVVTDTSSQVRARAVNSSTTLRIVTLGWIDEV